MSPRALAQRRQLDGDHVETPVQVRAKFSGGDLALQVAVGGGQDANVDSRGRLFADRVELAVLDEAQELGLDAQLHLADLVEEDGAAVGLREAARPRARRAGERPLGVAEQLGLDQVRGDGRAVHRHERLVLARRAGVQRAGGQLLAGARRAGDEDRAAGVGHLGDEAQRRQHRGIAPQQPRRVLVAPGDRVGFGLGGGAGLSRAATDSSSVRVSNGLIRKSRAPACIARTASGISALPLMAMTGVPGACRRAAARMSKPFTSGIRISVRMRSNRSRAGGRAPRCRSARQLRDRPRAGCAPGSGTEILHRRKGGFCP